MAAKTKDAAKKRENMYKKFLEFLNSPVWSLPVMSFIEQRSISKFQSGLPL